MKYVFTVIMFMITSNISAQVFEALDHHSLSNQTLKTIPYNSGLILIQSELERTHINYLKEDGDIIHLQTIFGEYFELNPGGIISNLESDGSITIHLCNLWDFDIISDIIYKINFDGLNSQYEEIRPYDPNSPSDMLFIDSSLHVLTYRGKLFKYENGIETELRRDFEFTEFYAKSNGEVYCFNTDSLVSFNQDFGLAFDTLTEVRDIIEDDAGSNIVLAPNKIQKYNTDFSQKLWSFNFPQGYNGANSISKKGNDIYIGLIANNQRHSIWKVDDSGINLFFESANSNTNFHEVHFVDSFQYLVGFNYNPIYGNTIINKLNINEAIQEDYDFIDIELVDIYVERKELISSSSRDSTYNYDVRFTVKNHSTDTIKHFNLFLNYYLRGTFLSFYDNEEFEIDTLILPAESLTFEKTGSWVSNQLNPLKFIIPGANYKRDADFSNNVKEVTVVINQDKDVVLNTIDVFPNPVEGQLNFNSQEKLLSTYVIYNINGQAVKSGNLESFSIKVNSLDSGMYVIHLTSKQGIMFQSKFIKL